MSDETKEEGIYHVETRKEVDEALMLLKKQVRENVINEIISILESMKK